MPGTDGGAKQQNKTHELFVKQLLTAGDGEMRNHTKLNKWFRWFIAGIKSRSGGCRQWHPLEPMDHSPWMMVQGSWGG